MPIKKFKALSPDPFINKIPGDTEFARLAHLNNLVDQINAQTTNIYTSNGTLTGPRKINCDYKLLQFYGLTAFFTSINEFGDWFGFNFNFPVTTFGNSDGGKLFLNQTSGYINFGITGGFVFNFDNQYNVKIGDIENKINGSSIHIIDSAAFPIQIYGTNVSANTAGAASGQFLKIKVGGVDYKIALLNP